MKRVKPPLCPYHKTEAILVDDNVVYQHSFGRKVWVCREYPTCNTYVGVHMDNNQPLGSMVDQLTREHRKEAHKTFDWIWKAGLMKRKEAYTWLAKSMNLTPEECHIGMMDIQECIRVIDLSNGYLNG